MLDDGPATSGSLLDRLHTWSDRSAWQRFFTNYNPLLEAWTKPRLHNPADAQELVQILWCELSRRLRSFRYNPRQSFRGWLRCLHTCRLSDFRKAERRRFTREHLYATEAAPPAINHITTAATDTPECPRRQQQLERAHRIQVAVRNRVSPKSWDVFHDVAILGLDISETANRHHMRYASAWAAFSRVHRMLQQEAAREDSA
jgi:RNA polymerase sigma factor (sigma-70 family)